MARIDGLQTYRIYLSMKLHLHERDFSFRTPINVSWEKYQSHKNIDVFEYLSFNYEEDFLYEFFLANIITNMNLQPVVLKNRTALKIYDKWKRDIDLIDTTFMTELKNICERFDISSPDDLFNLIENCINTKKSSDVQTIKSIDEMLDDSIDITNDTDNDVFTFLSNMNIHFLLVLDHIMKLYRNYSFLEDYMYKNPTIKEHSLITVKKYKMLLPVDSFMLKPKIKEFIDYL